MEGGAIEPRVGATLRAAFNLFSDLNQVLRVSVLSSSDPASWPPPLKARLVEIGGAPDFETLESRLREIQTTVRAAFVQVIGPPSDGTPPPARLN
jgi:hypothetical protein